MASGKTPSAPNGGPGTSQSVEQILAGAIDQIDGLRMAMRKIEKLDCAAVLDEAFAKCLRAYLEEREGRPIESLPGRRRLAKKMD